MGVVQPLFTAAFITPTLGKFIFIVGIIITVIGGIRGLIWKNEQFVKKFQQIIIWGITIIASLFIFKGPWTAVGQIINGNFQL